MAKGWKWGMFGNKRLYLSPLCFRLLDLNKGEGSGKFGKEAA